MGIDWQCPYHSNQEDITMILQRGITPSGQKRVKNIAAVNRPSIYQLPSTIIIVLETGNGCEDYRLELNQEDINRIAKYAR